MSKIDAADVVADTLDATSISIHSIPLSVDYHTSSPRRIIFFHSEDLKLAEINLEQHKIYRNSTGQLWKIEEYCKENNLGDALRVLAMERL